jgi:hypothetical protein
MSKDTRFRAKILRPKKQKRRRYRKPDPSTIFAFVPPSEAEQLEDSSNSDCHAGVTSRRLDREEAAR